MNQLINNTVNTLKFSLKSPKNLKILIKKIFRRLTGNNTTKQKSNVLLWIKNNCSNYEKLANIISPDTWIEAQQFSDALEKQSENKLSNIGVKLGGGGVYPFLYFITRLIKPKCIVETGVAAGYSSQTFLSAIEKNGFGFLYSSDLPYFRAQEPEKYIGILVDERLKKYWELHIKGDEINLPVINSKIKNIDIFHYDSDKSYEGRADAIKLFKDKLTIDSIIIFDDIQDNEYFHNYVTSNPNFEWYIFEFHQKFVGLIGNLSRYNKVGFK